MKKILKSFGNGAVIGMVSVGIFFGLIAILIYATQNEENGIIKLEGYPYAVVICGEALVINDGHYNDPQIAQLKERAETRCPKENK